VRILARPHLAMRVHSGLWLVSGGTLTVEMLSDGDCFIQSSFLLLLLLARHAMHEIVMHGVGRS